jgi:hypothetical protein
VGLVVDMIDLFYYVTFSLMKGEKGPEINHPQRKRFSIPIAYIRKISYSKVTIFMDVMPYTLIRVCR